MAGMFGGYTPEALPPLAVPQLPQMPAPKRGGMFGNMDIAGALQGAIGGYLAGMGAPGGAQLLSQANQRLMMAQQQKLEDARYQRERSDGLSDFETKLKLQAQYKPDAQPHYFEDNSGNLMAVGADGQPHEVYHDPNPWKLVPNGMGGVIPVNMQELMQGGAPSAPVGKLTPIAGGPTPQASGGFPGSY